jgi:hypothetical protein
VMRGRPLVAEVGDARGHLGIILRIIIITIIIPTREDVLEFGPHPPA